MRYLHIPILLTTLLTCCLLSSTADASCPCADGQLSGAQAEASADVVFWGRLVALEEQKDGRWRATFEPERGYKNHVVKAGAELDVLSPAPGEPCAPVLQVRRRYMVFASRQGSSLVTSICHGTEERSQAPLAPGVTSILPTPPSAGSLEARVSSSEQVVLAKATKVGRPFAGGWHNVPVTLKVERRFKGSGGSTFQARIDERACGSKRAVLAAQLDDDSPAKQDVAPIVEGERYILFLYGDAPHYVAPCHDHILDADYARDELQTLNQLCKKGCPGSQAAVEVAKVRRQVTSALESSMNKTLAMCRKKQPLRVKDEHFTDITLDLQLLPAGSVNILNLQSNGMFEDNAPYDRLNECLIEQVEGWKLPTFSGESVKAHWTIYVDERGQLQDVVFSLNAL
jgi:hypothetical protein